MNGESKQQELAEAIGKVVIPMVKTGDGIDDGPLQEFLLECSEYVLDRLENDPKLEFVKHKQP